MSNPLVSVVIPAYNVARYLGKTIESVSGQTYRNWEMLIVNDTSTDDTLSVSRAYASRDPRIKVFSLEHNSGGPATPRNYGIRMAQGDYIAFLDADDLWLPEKLQKQIEFFERNPDVFLLYAQCIIERNGKQLKIMPPRLKSGYIFTDLFVNFNIISCLTVMMRNKKEANTYFFDEDKRLVSVEDYAMWLNIAYNEKISFIHEPLAIYHIHSGSISSNAFLNFKKCGLVLRKFSAHVPKITLLRAYSNFYSNLLFVGIMSCLIWAKRSILNGISHA